MRTDLGTTPLVLKTGKLDSQHMQEELLMMLNVLHYLHKEMLCDIPVVIDKNGCHWLKKKIKFHLYVESKEQNK